MAMVMAPALTENETISVSGAGIMAASASGASASAAMAPKNKSIGENGENIVIEEISVISERRENVSGAYGESAENNGDVWR
jgi:hypothetical protein